MSDLLTRRGDTWHFVRRVPVEYAALDRRGIVRHSTRIKVAEDRTGRRAARVVSTLNEELERHWKGRVEGPARAAASRYDEARRPEIEIVARDRGGAYSEAVVKALPHATQVADRWHLMENASRAFLEPVHNAS